MTKKKSAKRAFISSFMSFIMCFAMLAGTTFAWYTDSVTSSGNKIIAGTLDIELWKYDGTAYVNISNSTAPIFQSVNQIAQNVNNDTLWEPGKTQVAYLKIKNNGNLWLKYQIALVVTKVTKDLDDAMLYKIVENAAAPEGVSAWDPTGAIPVADNTTDTASLAPEAEYNFALVIHMDENAGNEYMGGEIDFDITVLATQQTQEADSFNNQYDSNAAIPAIGKTSVVAGEPTVISAGENKATVPTDAVAAGTALQENDTIMLTIEPAGTDSSITIDDGNNATSYEVSLVNQNGEKVTSSTGITVELNVGQIDIQSFYHGNVELGEVDDIADLALNKYYYDPAEGKITFITDSFSPFTAEYKYSGGLGEEDYPYLISSAKDFYAIADDYEYDPSDDYTYNGYCYKLTSDITIENWCMNVIYVMKGAAAHDSFASAFYGIFDGCNHTIHFNWNDDSAMPETSAIALFGEVFYGGTIKNLTVDCNIVTDLDVGVLSSYTYYGAVFDNVTVSGTIRSTAKGGNLAAITLAAWESNASYHGLFKDCTVSADIYWEPVDKTTGYLYIGPYIAQLAGGKYLYFENCTSSGSLNIPYNSTVTDLYMGSFYGRNPNYSDVPAANIDGLIDNCTRNIYDGYVIHEGR